MHHGAADVLEKPVDLDTLSAAVTRASERGRLRQEVAVLRAQTRSAHQSYVTEPIKLPHTIEQLIDLAARNLDAPVLLQGETGTGKGFVARQIHDRSERNSAPFVEVNCASLSTSFFESGCSDERAFTDARQAKRGFHGGRRSVFSTKSRDGADVNRDSSKCWRTNRFGVWHNVTRSDARVIVATHQPLTQAVANGTFRADLYYRLQVLTLTIPPLRARPAEILPLAHAFLPRGATLDPSAEAQLLTYEWPGNIRELKNTIWRAAILADGAPIRVDHLGLVPLTADAAALPSVVDTTPRTLESIERDAIRAAPGRDQRQSHTRGAPVGVARSYDGKIKRYQL
jgi:DNA-binding NtrC family response regulator